MDVKMTQEKTFEEMFPSLKGKEYYADWYVDNIGIPLIRFYSEYVDLLLSLILCLILLFSIR